MINLCFYVVFLCLSLCSYLINSFVFKQCRKDFLLKNLYFIHFTGKDIRLSLPPPNREKGPELVSNYITL